MSVKLKLVMSSKTRVVLAASVAFGWLSAQAVDWPFRRIRLHFKRATLCHGPERSYPLH